MDYGGTPEHIKQQRKKLVKMMIVERNTGKRAYTSYDIFMIKTGK